MTFSEYAKGLSPYCSFGKSEADYFTELIGNFIQDAAMDACALLRRGKDTKYRYIKGSRQLPQWDRTEECDFYEAVFAWLDSNGVTCTEPMAACAELLESILLDIINSSSDSSQPVQESDVDLSLINEIQKK